MFFCRYNQIPQTGTDDDEEALILGIVAYYKGSFPLSSCEEVLSLYRPPFLFNGISWSTTSAQRDSDFRLAKEDIYIYT